MGIQPATILTHSTISEFLDTLKSPVIRIIEIVIRKTDNLIVKHLLYRLK